MLLGKEYGILNVDFLGGCAAPSNQERISFDYLGRVLYKNLGGSSPTSGLTTPYKRNNENRLIQSRCLIVLCNKVDCSDKNVTIAIEPETGYSHIF